MANKDELIEPVVDDVFGELRTPAVADRTPWRAAVTRTAADLGAMNLRLPRIATELG